MLVNISEYVIKPYQGYFEDKPEQWQRICKYFDEHIKTNDDGVSVEEEHGRSALAVIKELCVEDSKALKQVERGAMAFGDAQNNLWNAILRQMQENEQSGIRVPPKLARINTNVGIEPNTSVVLKVVERVKNLSEKTI